MNLSRRNSLSILGAAIASVLGRQVVKAQTTAQEIGNDGRIVATGDVWVEQEAAESQQVTIQQQIDRESPCTPDKVEVRWDTGQDLMLYQDERCTWQFLAPVPVISPACQFVVQCAP